MRKHRTFLWSHNKSREIVYFSFWSWYPFTRVPHQKYNLPKRENNFMWNTRTVSVGVCCIYSQCIEKASSQHILTFFYYNKCAKPYHLETRYLPYTCARWRGWRIECLMRSITTLYHPDVGGLGAKRWCVCLIFLARGATGTDVSPCVFCGRYYQPDLANTSK